MNLGRAWGRQLLNASGAALLAPGAVVGSLAVLALAGGFAHLGSLGEAFAGPSLQALPMAARIAASRSARRPSPVLVALAAQPTGGAGPGGVGTVPGAAPGSGGSGTGQSGGGTGSVPQGGPTGGGTGGHSGHGGPGPGSPPPTGPPPAPVPHPTVVDGVVSIGTSVTKQVPGPVGSLATHTLQSAGHTLDGILTPPAGGAARSVVRGVRSGLRVP